MAAYRNRSGPTFSKESIWKPVKNIDVLDWWNGFINHTNLSKHVAYKILSAPLISAATERTFSTFSKQKKEQINKRERTKTNFHIS